MRVTPVLWFAFVLWIAFLCGCAAEPALAPEQGSSTADRITASSRSDWPMINGSYYEQRVTEPAPNCAVSLDPCCVFDKKQVCR